MSRPRISVVTPVYIANQQRLDKFLKCIESVKNQDYDGLYEHIIVNDGSTFIVDVPGYDHIRVVNQPNLQRITAYDRGIKEAKGEIICLLDSDDEYISEYLSTVDSWFRKFPRYKIFNFGNYFIHPDGAITERGAFKPKRKRKGHEIFGGGNIVNGTFVFSREVVEKLGAYPNEKIEDIDCSEIGYGEGKRSLLMTSPYDFSAYAQMEFPEIRPYFQVVHPDHPKGLVKELGNPYGNDFYLFYKYTRKYHSKPMDEKLLRVNLKKIDF